LKSEGKEKIENIEKTREYIEHLSASQFESEIPEKNGETFKRIIEGINKGSEEETELLKLIVEIEYQIIKKFFYESIFERFLDDSGIKEYVKNKVKELIRRKEKSKENEYYIILSHCLLIKYIREEDEKTIKKTINFFKELKMDKISTIEEKKKRIKEIFALDLYHLGICL